MSAPTIKNKVTADTAEFVTAMKGVVSQLQGAGKQMNKFASTAKRSGDGGLKNFKKNIRDMTAALKPLGSQLAAVGKQTAKWGSAVAAGAAVGGAAIVATSLSSIKELRNLARLSDVSAASLQRSAFAAQTVGVDMEQYAQALKDVNDRLGDFASTGAGPMVDFFEQIAPKVGITAAAFEGLNSEQSLALYVKTLEDANVTQQEMTFYMEAIASDATKLIPLFTNNAKAMNQLKNEARELGIGLSEIDVQQAMNAQSQLSKIGAIIKNEVLAAVVELAPFVTALGKHMVNMFKGVREETGGLAGMMQRFALGVVDYIDAIANAFGYVGRGMKVLSGIFDAFTGTLKMAIGLAMRSVSSVVEPVLQGIIGTIQFVGNAFSGGFTQGIINSLKMINLKLWDYLHYPLEQFYSLLAKLPDNFGGDFFKKSLADVQELRKQVAGAQEDLRADVMAPNLDTDTTMGQFNLMLDTMRSNGEETLGNIFGAGGILIEDGYAQGLEGGLAFNEGLFGSIDTDTYRQKLTDAMGKVQQEMINLPTGGEGNQDPQNEPLGETATGATTAPEQMSAVDRFRAETEKLLEAQLERYMSEDELKMMQYQKELEMLREKQASELGLTEEQKKKLEALERSSAEIQTKINKDNMQTGLQLLTEGSGKASKIMKKVAIANALLAGKESAILAWKSGMSTGGPFAPVVAAAYTAASLARTGAMIASIKGSGSGSSGGGGGASAVNSAQSQSGSMGQGSSGQQSQSPSRIFNVEFMGESSASTQQTRNLLELINEQAGDNVQINLRGG